MTEEEINYQRMWDTLKRQISHGELSGVYIINPVTPYVEAAQQMESERECLEK